MREKTPSREPAGLPFAAILPALLVSLALAGIGVSGAGLPASRWVSLSPLVFASLPWATLIILREPVASLGYSGERALARFGWGMLAGALWRAASLALNAAWEARLDRLGAGPADWLTALVWVPFVEETYYRGFLGLGLRPRCGRLGAVVIQAVLFTLHPLHWTQGPPHIVGIFAFGLLAGALVVRTGSIWPAWGAHALANAIPLALAQISAQAAP